jgi:nucleoid-associated protein YgaU
MQRDVKIGIAIGVLLIALIAVFWWFRHNNRTNPVPTPETPTADTGFPTPIVPVSPVAGIPGETGPMVSPTAPAPAFTGGAPVPPEFTPAPAVTAVRVLPPAPGPAATQTYKVQKGDTLSSISEHFYKTPARWMFIYSLNKDKIGPDPAKLKEGMELVISEGAAGPPLNRAPGAVGTPPAAAGGKYIVATGDTLTSIAQKEYGSATKANIDRIYQANKAKIGPDPDDLKPGTELTIPAAH